MTEKSLTIEEAVKEMHISVEAIYQAIKKNRLKAVKGGKRWYLTEKDIEDYQLSKFNRDLQPIFSIEEGRYSTGQAAKILTDLIKRPFSADCVRDKFRRGEIKAEKKGSAWVVTLEELEKFYNSINKEDDRQMRFA